MPTVGSSVKSNSVTVAQSSPIPAAAHCNRTPRATARIPVTRKASTARAVPIRRSAAAITVSASTIVMMSCAGSSGTNRAVNGVHQKAARIVLVTPAAQTSESPPVIAVLHSVPVMIDVTSTIAARVMLAGAIRT